MPEPAPLLLAVPNISEGADPEAIAAIADAFAPATLLDVHSDPDHGRSVFTLAARQGELARALVAGARAAAERIDLRAHTGSHPHVGALDVAPVVHLDAATRGAAVAEALTAAALIGDEAGLPVFLYGELATAPDRRERAALRSGGPGRLAQRVAAGELTPDFGPRHVEPVHGAVLVTARPPLVAFNLDLATDDVELARRIAAGLRESGGGPPGVRAIGLLLPHRGRAQVSLNVHDHRAVPLAALVELVAAQAPIAEAELVGLAPAAALEGLPDDLSLRGFDPDRHVIENALRSAGL
ncbi:MAG: glutamate formiminotransferase / 5-formyltetrahydrofolate cyclo-ligase [Thermoleophilaceae bacterium]|nr:glutamate formiminotransferase / 5-formyltetrahydrofolate cyclo-ligase [Thermoleophilaceae bacterium]